MKLVLPLAAVALFALSQTDSAAALDAKSKAPDWVSASKADKDGWVKSFKL